MTLICFYPDTYDAVVVAGGMGEGHIPCNALYEMIRIVKPGNVWILYALFGWFLCNQALLVLILFVSSF